MKSLLLPVRMCCLLLGLLSATPMLAHNKLNATVPEQGAVLTQSPGSVELRFADAAYLEAVQLQTVAGETVALDFELPAELLNSFSIPLPALLDGSYRLLWKVEGSDTHVLEGELGFTVQQAAP